MANAFTYQALKDTTSQLVVKLTGTFDGASGQESNLYRIAANTLYGALDANNVPLKSGLSVSNTPKPSYGLSIQRVWADTNIGARSSSNGYIELRWSAINAANANTAMLITGPGTWNDTGSWPAITNNAGIDKLGDIGVVTQGAAANSSYTIILELRKDAAAYQRGQFNDPAAFNYGAYSVKP